MKKADLDKKLFVAVVEREVNAVRRALNDGASASQMVAGDRKTVSHTEVPLLAIAAFTGNARVVELLLDAGAEIEWTCSDLRFSPISDDEIEVDSGTALAIAAKAGHEEIVRLLLERGANPSGPYPLCFAAKAGHLPIVQALVEAGASPCHRNGDSHTPMYFAAKGGHEHVLDYLHNEGGFFHGRHDLEGAQEYLKGGQEYLKGAKYAAVRTWFKSKHDRQLLKRSSTWWRAHTTYEGLDDVFAELFGLLRSKSASWGDVLLDETLEGEWGGGSRSTSTVHTLERSLGGLSAIRKETERIRKGIEHKHIPSVIVSKSVHYSVPGAQTCTLSWKKTMEQDSTQAPVVLIGCSGSPDKVGHFDSRLESASLSFNVESLPDDDSDYDARRRLKKTLATTTRGGTAPHS